ncbi:uncharacterized protein A4U43_UnF9340 [Asparagus officinalis]|uniref:Uncharacterized protein n=1 Tax=Asparagus officinalis TaxID=4686 RepID=A0A1R3L5R0_ASPOF|nr:uncharacterized protein A4U43_UnF9340 [Asparagus officinalis]
MLFVETLLKLMSINLYLAIVCDYKQRKREIIGGSQEDHQEKGKSVKGKSLLKYIHQDLFFLCKRCNLITIKDQNLTFTYLLGEAKRKKMKKEGRFLLGSRRELELPPA